MTLVLARIILRTLMSWLSAAVILLFGYSISTVIRCHAAEVDSPAVQTLKSMAPQTEPEADHGSTTQAIPYRIAPQETLGRSSKGDLECPYRTEESCDRTECRTVIIKLHCPK
jgi:hypothetical protein